MSERLRARPGLSQAGRSAAESLGGGAEESAESESAVDAPAVAAARPGGPQAEPG